MRSQLLSPQKTSQGPVKPLLGFAVLVVCVVLATILIWQRQLVADMVVVGQFQPSASVAKIADRASMSDKGRFYFYAAQPEIDDAQRFNSQCARNEERSAILGCYAGGRIYIYNITDSQLDGIKEVTAAHEMLHSAWDRLSGKEKERLAGLLESEYQKHVDDNLKDRMDYYARNQAGQRANELHSIIGTEYENIGGELEDYYRRYFTDRLSVVSLHGNYSKVFIEIEERSLVLVADLNALASEISNKSNEYNKLVSQLNAAIASFNDRARSGVFASQYEFSIERSQLITRSNDLNAKRSDIDKSIKRHESMRSELDSLSTRSEALTRSIDSTLAPAPSI